MVSHSNVISFIDAIVQRYRVSPGDRLSQTFDMTFDLSVFDMFVAWECGACVCCLPQKALINPGRFINEKKLTIWFSVPSTGVFMKKLGALKAGRYPSLRLSLFCGEPLPVEIAQAWQDAAPNSFVENLYGPTEATIACMVYRWDATISPAQCLHGVVPIGVPLNGMKAVVVRQSMAEVAEGAEGELLLCGPQVSLGYWQDPDRTKDAFVSLPGLNGIFYRTGDRVRRPRHGAPMTYLGRVDHQIQIHGHRVELGEIESVLRDESGESGVIALGWPVSVSGAGGVVAFIGQEKLDVEKLKTRLSARLPEYMVPREIRLLNSLPLNANGKFDRKALLRLLEDEE
jgi:non-ribosomal peptide synthetase component F